MKNHEATERVWIDVYRQTVGPLYAFVARRAGGDRELAEDVTQEAWLRAVSHWGMKGPPAEPLAWLRTVARNILWNHYRRRRPAFVGPGALDLPENAAAPETPEAAALLHWGLGRLSRRQARLLERFHLDGVNGAALARELRLSERAIEGRLRRAREALKRKLAPHLGATGRRS